MDPSRLNLMNGEVTSAKSKMVGSLPTLYSRLKECFMNAQKETGYFDISYCINCKFESNYYLDIFRYHLACQFVKELRADRETLKDDELRAVS